MRLMYKIKFLTKSFHFSMKTSPIYFLIIKLTRCTNFSNLFMEWNSSYFGQFLCSSLVIFHCTHSNGKRHTGYANSLRAGSGWNCSSILILFASCHFISRINIISFHCKNKFEKLVHVVGFIIRSLSRCTVTWTSEPLPYISAVIYTHLYGAPLHSKRHIHF
jgi:hypothetical protein